MNRPSPSRPASWKIAAGVDLDAGRGRDGDDDVLDGRQGLQGVADEVGVAGGVDQVDLLPLPFEVAAGGSRW